jgi:hypothetical protein
VFFGNSSYRIATSCYAPTEGYRTDKHLQRVEELALTGEVFPNEVEPTAFICGQRENSHQ